MRDACILVVEDNAATRKMMRVALQAEGYSVLEADDGQRALELVEQRLPALVLLDCKLPGLDGVEVARRLRAQRPELPLIAVTGWAQEAEARVLTVGFQDVLVKPVDPSRLIEVVQRHLGRAAGQWAVSDKRLLLVDDDPTQRKLMQLALSHAGFRVTLADGGRQALELARASIPDVILSDVLMPDMDGFALCQAVRAEPALRGVPIVLMSAHYVEEEDQRLGAGVGASFYVSRSTGLDAVISGVVEALSLPVPRRGAPDLEDVHAAHVRRIAHQLDRQASAGAALTRQVSLQATALSVLDKLSESLSRQLDPENALGETLAECLDAAGLSVGAILLQSADGSLAVKAHVGTPILEDWGTHKQILNVGINGGGLVMPSAKAGAAGDALLAAVGAKSALLVPIIARDQSFGALLLASMRTELAGAEGDSFVRAARSVSRQLGQALALSATFGKLAAAEQRYRALFESANEAIAVLNPEGLILEVNRGCERLMGLSREQMLGRNFADLIPPELRESRTAEYREALKLGGGPVAPLTVRRSDGSAVSVEVSRTLVEVQGERYVLSMARDVTERRRLEEQLRQSQKMEAVGQLAGGIAHDFNNLLSVILSYTTMILDDLSPEDPLRRDIEQIRRAGERSSELTRQLLAFSRKQMLEPKILDLNGVLAGTEPMLRRLLGEGVELSLLTFNRVGHVVADPGQIEQVIVNLAVNSHDAMPHGGKLTIETADVELDESYAAQHHGVTPGSYVMLAISDTGTGMDDATLARIFEPFFTTKEKGRGTGLGLATVFGIVKQSGGHIWVYSEPGRGTTFKIYLPRVQGGTAASAIAQTPIAVLRGSETILLVEDQDQLRTLARTVLGRNGYNVLEAQNGGEALLVCEQYAAKIHLLVTDVVMPRMSGRQLVDRLAAQRPDMKVLFMSGYTDNAIVHHGVIDAGVAFLQKPLTPAALLRKVREVLDEGSTSARNVAK